MITIKNPFRNNQHDQFDTMHRPADKARSLCAPKGIIARRVYEMTDEIECTYLYQRAQHLENMRGTTNRI